MPPSERVSMSRRAQLSIGFSALMLTIFAAGGALTTRQLETALLGEARRELERAAQMLDALAHARGPVTNFDALADELGQLGDLRVSFIDATGRVVGDSAVASAMLDRLDNHGDRPEVKVAREGTVGFSVRESKTVNERMAYLAAPLDAHIVMRTARTMRDADAAIGRLQLAVALAGLAAWLLGLGALRLSDKQRLTLLAQMAEGARASKQQAQVVTELGEEKERYGRILAGMQEGVLVVDDDGRIALVNRALREMLLLSNDVVGKALIEVVRNADLQATIERTKAEGIPQASELETGGLKPRILLAQTSPLPGYGQVVVFVDVTDIRRLESLRRDFVANVSHELRTPVTAIRSAAETLKTSALQDPKAAATFVDMMARNAERLGDLVEDLLDLSRIESKAYRLTLEPLNVVAVANYCLSLFRERAQKKSLTLRTQTENDIPAVRADRRALEQVLTNLIDNAVKYCPDGAAITIAAEARGHEVCLRVADTGRGIDEKHLPRLFERFYRVDAGRGRDTGGTGLGLSIAKHLVEAMGGSISVESAPGKGTTFFVMLAQA